MCRPELGSAATETLLWFALRSHTRHSAAQWSAQTKAQTKLSRTSARLLTGRGGGANHRANQSLLGTPPAKGEGRTGLLWSNVLRCCSPTSAQVGHRAKPSHLAQWLAARKRSASAGDEATSLACQNGWRAFARPSGISRASIRTYAHIQGAFQRIARTSGAQQAQVARNKDGDRHRVLASQSPFSLEVVVYRRFRPGTRVDHLNREPGRYAMKVIGLPTVTGYAESTFPRYGSQYTLAWKGSPNRTTPSRVFFGMAPGHFVRGVHVGDCVRRRFQGTLSKSSAVIGSRVRRSISKPRPESFGNFFDFPAVICARRAH